MIPARGRVSPGLEIARWALRIPGTDDPGEKASAGELLDVDPSRPGETPMAHSAARGDGLVSNGFLGVDAVRVPAGGGFVPHTHPGDHILIVVAGLGTITYDGKVYPTEAGQVYMINGEVPHAVGARSDHVILAVGAPHRRVDDPERMAPVEYAAVASPIGDLTCLACEPRRVATHPKLLHEYGCTHCPCTFCVGV